MAPEQKESAPPVRQKGSLPIAIATAPPGLKMLEPSTASPMPLRNFIYPARMLCVKLPVVKSKPPMCEGVLLAFRKGVKVFGTNALTLLFCS